MRIYPNQPLAFSHVGQRPTNQDVLYPALGQATEHTGLFLVCDGMGGADKGEVASQLLRDTVAGYARAMDYPPLDMVHLRTALALTDDAYRSYQRENPLVGRMGSTLALLQFHGDGATVAHLGDSRVYQLRDGQMLFRTQDHRQVADMVREGIITAEQALTHPWRNRLSRAVVADPIREPDHTAFSTPDISLLTDVQSGDYFFICTDGVSECIDDETLATTLTAGFSDQTKLQTLLTTCQHRARDNYSGYLISIREVVYT